MIRSTTPEETNLLVTLTEETGVFKPHEVVALREVLDEYHLSNRDYGHRAVTYEEHGIPIGFAYFAPAAMTDRTWYLYWIAVSKKIQAKGVGGSLLKYAEDEIRKANGRVLFIETSSLPHYDLTRKFYVKQGYETAAVLKDYYSDGDDMVVFSKRMAE
jgi:ribosomal protein S18 acetylase RimI-like enzyme